MKESNLPSNRISCTYEFVVVFIHQHLHITIQVFDLSCHFHMPLQQTIQRCPAKLWTQEARSQVKMEREEENITETPVFCFSTDLIVFYISGTLILVYCPQLQKRIAEKSDSQLFINLEYGKVFLFRLWNADEHHVIESSHVQMNELCSQWEQATRGTQWT